MQSVAAAFGPPLIHINLLPSDSEVSARRMALSGSTMGILFALAVIFGLMTLISTIQGMRVAALRTEVEALQAEARELRPLIARIEQLETERALIRGRLDVIGQLDQDRFVRVRLADELSRRLPDQVWLTSFSENQEAIVISGITFSNLSVADLISRLERSVLYENVDLVVSRRANIDDHEVLNFTITARRQMEADRGREPVPTIPAG